MMMKLMIMVRMVMRMQVSVLLVCRLKPITMMALSLEHFIWFYAPGMTKRLAWILPSSTIFTFSSTKLKKATDWFPLAAYGRSYQRHELKILDFASTVLKLTSLWTQSKVVGWINANLNLFIDYFHTSEPNPLKYQKSRWKKMHIRTPTPYFQKQCWGTELYRYLHHSSMPSVSN